MMSGLSTLYSYLRLNPSDPNPPLVTTSIGFLDPAIRFADLPHLTLTQLGNTSGQAHSSVGFALRSILLPQFALSSFATLHKEH